MGGSSSSSSIHSDNWAKWDKEFFGNERKRDLVYGFVTEDNAGDDGGFFAISTLSYGTLLVYYLIWLVVYTLVVCTCGACCRLWFRCCCKCCIRTPKKQVGGLDNNSIQNPLKQLEDELKEEEEEEEEKEKKKKLTPTPSIKKRRKKRRKNEVFTENAKIKTHSF